MKTPRDLFLSQHRGAEDQLDALRRQAILGTVQPSQSLWLKMCLAELFLPNWKAWLSLTAAWLAIALLHFSSGPSPAAEQPTFASTQIAWKADADVLAALNLISAPEARLPQ